jgi:hypothetical protein
MMYLKQKCRGIHLVPFNVIVGGNKPLNLCEFCYIIFTMKTVIVWVQQRNLIFSELVTT